MPHLWPTGSSWGRPLDYGPVLLRKPFGPHLTVGALSSAVPSWRLQVHLGCVRLSPACPCRCLHTCHLRPARHYPRLWIRPPSSGGRRDFNPPDQCAAWRTLLAHPPPSRLRPTSRDAGYRAYLAPVISHRGEEGFLQLLGLSLSSCCRYHPAEVGQPCQSAFGRPCCLRPRVAGSAFGIHCRGHLCVHSRYGPMTRNLPKGDLVDRLQKFGFSPPCYPSYGAPDSYPGGTVSR